MLRFVLALGDLSQVAQQGDREVVFAGLLRSDHLVDPFPGRISLGREVIETLGARRGLGSGPASCCSRRRSSSARFRSSMRASAASSNSAALRAEAE
jgi:hypothetical protein